MTTAPMTTPTRQRPRWVDCSVQDCTDRHKDRTAKDVPVRTQSKECNHGTGRARKASVEQPPSEVPRRARGDLGAPESERQAFPDPAGISKDGQNGRPVELMAAEDTWWTEESRKRRMRLPGTSQDFLRFPRTSYDFLRLPKILLLPFKFYIK